MIPTGRDFGLAEWIKSLQYKISVVKNKCEFVALLAAIIIDPRVRSDHYLFSHMLSVRTHFPKSRAILNKFS